MLLCYVYVVDVFNCIVVVDDVDVGVDDLRKQLEARALVESGWS